MNSYINFNQQIEISDSFDVVVCGGGTSGVAAAVAAARNGCRVAILEQHGYLGGSPVSSGVSIFAYGFHDKDRYILSGLFGEIRDTLHARGQLIKTRRYGWEPYNPEGLKCLLDEWAAKENIKVYAHCSLIGVIKREDNIEHVVAFGPEGIFAIHGKVFIDASGDAVLSYLSDVEYKVGRDCDGAIQPYTMIFTVGGVDIEKVGAEQERGYWVDEEGGAYLSATGFYRHVEKSKADKENPIPRENVASIFSIPWLPGVVGVNYGRVFANPQLSGLQLYTEEAAGRTQAHHAYEFLKKYVPGFEKSFLLSTACEIGRRDSRRIVGEYILTEDDVRSQRQFNDVIVQCCYMIDIHLPDQIGTMTYKLPKGTHFDIPYRCLLPKTVNNLIVVGRCISAEHSALGSIRVQPVCIALGEAGGIAASISIKQEVSPKLIDIDSLQSELISRNAIIS